MAKISKRQGKKSIVNNGLARALDLDENPIYSVGPNSPNILASYSSPFLITRLWLLLTNAYNKNAFLQTAVNQMVEDAFRNDGLIIDSKQLTTDELEKLRVTMDEEGDINAIIDCIRWGRLYGGGALIANTEQDYTLPLSEKQLQGKRLKFLAVNRWQCMANGTSPYTAETFTLTDSLSEDERIARNSGIQIDKSRVCVFTGRTSPYMTSAWLNGWNASIFEGILEPITELLGAFNVTLELLSEAKIDIFKISGLADMLVSPDGENLVRKRLRIATENKNSKCSIAMGDTDDYNQKQINFGGIPELLQQLMYIFCGYLRYPVSKLFGKGSSGFSNGNDDLENYNGTVDSDVRVPARNLIRWVVKLRCYQLFGHPIDDFMPRWKPLKVMSEKEQAEINSRKLNDYLELCDRKIMTKQQVAQKLTEDGYVLFSPEEMDRLKEFNNER